jgi:hypothetical protein
VNAEAAAAAQRRHRHDAEDAAGADAAQAAYDADVAGARRGRCLRAAGMLTLYVCWCVVCTRGG